MIRNYLKVALRSIKRHKGYSIINIAGLTVGMACCFFILLYVRDELSFDRFHELGDRLYRVVVSRIQDGEGSASALTPAPLAAALKEDIPEVVEAACFNRRGAGPIRYGETVFEPDIFEFTDPAFFKMFSFDFVKGNPAAALDDPYSIVLTEDSAQRYFGQKEPLGEILEVANRFSLRVTGIIKTPKNSHVALHHVVSKELYKEIGVDITSWNQYNYTTYILLARNASDQDVSQKIGPFLFKIYGEQYKSELRLQPIKRIYLHSNYAYDIHTRTSDIRIVYLLSLIAFFILIIACANFMNLATARAGRRIREVGLRKVVGAQRRQLVLQFLSESIFLSFSSLMLAAILVKVVLPSINSLALKQLRFLSPLDLLTVVFLVGITLLTGLIAGSYPAFFLSSFKPVQTVRGTLQTGKKGSLVRKILVIGQFSVSVLLIISTLVVYKQLRFIQNKHLGYEKEHLVTLDLNPQFATMYLAFKDSLLQDPNVLSVTATMNLPNWEWPGTVLDSWEGRSSEKEIPIKHGSVDYDFFKTFQMDFVLGRPFKREFPTDATTAVIVNEEAVRQMELEDPLGKRLDMWGHAGQIIGVVKDFNFDSVRNKIEPLVLKLAPEETHHLVVRISPDNLTGGIRALERMWVTFVKDYPFEFRFLDDVLNRNYMREAMMGKVFTSFAVLAIFIGCLGLFGLASFLAEQKTKEIGVRKVLGASVSGIVLMLTKDFTKWIVVANLVALPAAVFLSSLLLRGYAYRTSLGVFIFLLPVIFSLVIAWITVSYQSIRAALADPVKSLRYE